MFTLFFPDDLHQSLQGRKHNEVKKVVVKEEVQVLGVTFAASIFLGFSCIVLKL
jgi:hypothetical protein